ncbi:MAG TPA: amino acid adenylation domain-containing protein [Pyrinomonadaceae bacterium]|nr:amino acid adenylation domain-containing protein [Pyrinomonadaceae bacterium]
MSEPRDFLNMDGLDADKLELFEYLLEEEGIEGASPTEIISPRERTQRLPLSFAQQRLWFLEQLEPGSAAYHIAGALRMVGQLDTDALSRSLNEIVRRHESLRTSFIIVAGQPEQSISPAREIVLPVEDFTALPADEREAEMRRLSREEAHRPFDLSQSPLWRTRLLRMSEDEHVLLLTMHHIISDGWSSGVLVRELATLYEAYRKGAESPLAELPVQYADYALWQREYLTGETLESQLDYWRRQLGGNLPVLELPTQRARASVQTFRAASHPQVLPEELSEALKELSLREDATLFMILLAALQVLLSRYSGQTDLLTGTPVAGRTRAETEALIGFFVNTLVLRTQLDERLSFREFLAQVKEVCLEAYAHQEVPFEKLVEELQPERNLSRTPLFQVMFTLQNTPMPVIELTGLKLSLLETDTEAAQFDLALEVMETPEGLKSLWRYNRDLFDGAMIARMAEQFRTLLESVAADCGVPIAELSLLTERESQRLLFELNETATDYPRDSSIHELFERQAEATPDALALSFEGEQLTYAELNRRANQVAHYLIGMGVGAEMRVGIMLERSLEMIVGLLGILKAGGAYVPLDPTYPHERLAFMIEDAMILVLLTQEQHLDSAFAQQVVCLDSDWELIAAESTENPSSKVDAENLAYIIYTSGSTGRPKGVCISHRGVVRLVRQTNYADFSPEEVFLQLAPVTFDASTFEIWGALLCGARLALMPPGVALSEEIGAAIRQHQVTTLWLTAGLFHLMVEERLPDLRALRHVLAGGDVLNVRHVNRFVSECPGSRLTNGYGPTENTTFTCCHHVEQAEQGASVPIGRPLSNTRVYILDERMRPVGTGIVGELYTGGDGLARCYLNRPELTAEKFLPDPFSGEVGARLYRTGDSARYRADGTIEFIGRGDQQVKLRGFRIELGEIEAALSAHAAVRECLVLVREDASGDKRLAAYFTADEAETPTHDELRRYLRERLPEYMIPAAFVALEAFPLTDNGKIDRRALPAPEDSLPSRENLYVAPRNATEEALAAIIRDVLGIERVSIYDNFFDMGGHSLLATQVITCVRDTFHVDLHLKRFFEHPSIADLAASIEAFSHPGLDKDAPSIKPVPRERALPLSFAQQRLWFLDQLEPGNPIYNLPTALRLRGALDVEALRRTLNEIVRRHEPLRTVFREKEGEVVQVILPEQLVEMPLLNLSSLTEAEREREAERLARAEAQRGFDLSRGPQLRATLLQLSTEEHLLLFTMHHIISDGWSSGVLVREVATLYEAYAQGKESPLPELPVQYADYAVWQRDWLQGEVLTKQLAYWKKQLDGSPALLEFPTDYQRPAALTFRGAVLGVELSAQLTEELRALARREGVTLYMILLAAFQTLLSRYTGQQDIVVGSPIANRQRREIEPLIGFFVNTLVLRTDLSGNPSFRQLLKRVQEVTLGAYTHQDIPFEMLVEELQPERNLAFTPLFQMMFALQNAPGDELKLPGLALSRLDVWGGTTHFDLTLQLEESAQGLTGVVEYSVELFREETIRRLTRQLQTLLESIVADPDAPLSALPLLDDAEKQQLLARWTTTPCKLERDEWPGNLPSGVSLTDAKVFLLDVELQPVPAGVLGELYLGGAEFVRQFADETEQADHFIPHPFSDEKDARLYRTGDAARYRADGRLEYVGRMDDLSTHSATAGRRTRPVSTQTQGDERVAYAAPRTPTEEILASIWSDVLKVERVGIHDNFFDLGGHSLLATQLMSRVRNAFHLEVPLRLLFEHANVADLARRIDAGLRDGQELKSAPITSRKRDGHLPLSFSQQRLWFIDQLQPGTSTYHIPVALNISGALDVETLERSLAEIMRRHESLRTSFTVSEGQPVQVIAPDSGFTLPQVDLSALTADEQEAEAQRLSREEAHRPFDLQQSPLWRTRLLRMGEDEHVLLLTMHHIISDGWSSGVLVRELAALYEAYRRGEESPLPELAVQYGDYALWQREHLTGETLESQLAYWKKQLAGAPQLLELPTRQPRSVAQTFRGAREELTLSPQLTRWLKALSRSEGATLYMTLLAAFKVLLWRYSRQSDILVGSPIANRNRAETEALIGFFVNTLVLRTQLDERVSFREFLAQVKEVCLEAYAHQEVPFEKLVEELQPERNLSRTPLFQVMFALQNAPMPPLKLEQLKLSLTDVPGETAKFDLTLSLEESGGGLSGAFEYNSDLFDAAIVRRMAVHYAHLLESIVEKVEAPLSTLSLLSAAERRQLLVEWNDTAHGEAASICAHQGFEQQAALTPEVAAAVSEQEHVSYAELNRRANRLAHHLRGLGVRAETPVCICIERSVNLLVGILAIAKAGGAYVPLDPSYPAQRLTFMLEDSRAPVLLTHERMRGVFDGCEAALVLLDRDAEAIARQSSENPSCDVLPGNLAYVIYTSGSTGKPKSVEITHASLMNLIGWYRRTSPVAPGERVAQLSGVGFDASVFELWPNLTAGMTSYLPDEETRLTPEKLRDWLVSRHIKACFAPTPLAELILTLDWPPETTLRALYTGGDTLHHFPAAALPFQVRNSYGPTENTVIATSGHVTPEDAAASYAPHIGRPIDNVEVYLLDQNMEPVPVGVRGELYVGGASLARGYAHEPRLTAESFIPHPFASAPGARLYRTGDAARYLPDGRIEFLSRLDNQVKIRGFRIELGEIEVVLKKHEDVREAVVACDEVRPGEHRLTAYLALETQAQPSLDKLRGYLMEKLPEYMIPSAFVMMERLPLNANGKIDRRALSAAGVAHLTLEATYVAPATELERVIAKLWQELLVLERVGIHDNFFDLGGHSLLIIQMRSRLQEILQREIAVIELFKYPTVSTLARHLSRDDAKQQSAHVSPHRQRAEARRESAAQRMRHRQKQPTL